MKLIKHVLEKKGRTVWTVEAQDSVHQAVKLMAKKDIGSVVIVEDGKMVGARGIIRDAVSGYGIEEVYSTRRDELELQVTEELANERFSNIKITTCSTS